MSTSVLTLDQVFCIKVWRWPLSGGKEAELPQTAVQIGHSVNGSHRNPAAQPDRIVREPKKRMHSSIMHAMMWLCMMLRNEQDLRVWVWIGNKVRQGYLDYEIPPLSLKRWREVIWGTDRGQAKEVSFANTEAWYVIYNKIVENGIKNSGWQDKRWLRGVRWGKCLDLDRKSSRGPFKNLK